MPPTGSQGFVFTPDSFSLLRQLKELFPMPRGGERLEDPLYRAKYYRELGNYEVVELLTNAAEKGKEQ